MTLHDYAGCSMHRSALALAFATPIPRPHTAVPRQPRTAAFGGLGERTGSNAQLGERGAWRGALSGTRGSLTMKGGVKDENVRKTKSKTSAKWISFGATRPYQLYFSAYSIFLINLKTNIYSPISRQHHPHSNQYINFSKNKNKKQEIQKTLKQVSKPQARIQKHSKLSEIAAFEINSR